MTDIYDFNGGCNQVYMEKCTCGQEIKISTQTDHNPEYYTDIFVKCICGKSVYFHLPVN